MRNDAAEADDRVETATREHPKAGRVSLVGAHEVEHDIGARAVRPFPHRIGDVPLLPQHLVRTKLARKNATALVGVYGDHRCSPEHAGELERDVADPAD